MRVGRWTGLAGLALLSAVSAAAADKVTFGAKFVDHGVGVDSQPK